MKLHLETYFQQESERLIYRRLTEDDIESWQEFFADNDRLHFLAIDTSSSIIELATTWVNKQMERYQQEGLGLLGVIEKSSRTLIGMGGILPRNLNRGEQFEIAYSLKPKFWKKGYGTEIANQMKRFGIENNISREFISIIEKNNLDSINVAIKNDMKILFESTYLGMDVYIYGTQIEQKPN